jgi:hypothetical protein
MPIVGESVWSLWAYQYGSGSYTASWDFRFPPNPRLVKVYLSLISVFSGDNGAGRPYIQSIRKRLSDGTDQQLDFHDPYHHNDYIQAYYDDRLSGVTVGLMVDDSWSNVMIVIEDWR